MRERALSSLLHPSSSNPTTTNIFRTYLVRPCTKRLILCALDILLRAGTPLAQVNAGDR